MNYVQKFYLKKLGEYLRKTFEEKRSSNKKMTVMTVMI